jgi:23S rRNA pseudouridine955/2504/2580 synthase
MLESVTISEEDNGQRLDRWLKKHYPDTAFGEMQKILRTGQLRVDGKRVKGDARLVTGQILRIPPQLRTAIPKNERGISQKDTIFIQSIVIYQDDDLIAINKPAGLATQGGTKVGKHVDGFLDGLKFDGNRPHLVHRLDKETSGVLLLARSPRAAREMGEIFRGRDIKKIYWAVTSPAPLEAEGKIKSFIAKVDVGGGERVMAVDEEEGKMALTNYSVIEVLGSEAAWVAFWPRTGRTHQIRVHAAEMGFPLVGDYKYGPDQSFLEANTGIPNVLHLHARRLIFEHPFTGKKVDITAPLGPEMRSTFKHYGFNANDKSDPFEGVE